VLGILSAPSHDPMAEAEQRESLRRLIADVRRLPDQQRSALLMRELGGMAYTDVAAALGTSVPAVKSLLVRARVSLAAALEARDTACAEIREELMVAHDRGVRPSGLARRHMHDCAACREFRGQMRGVSRQFAALAPTIGPLGVVANLLGIGGGAGAGGGAAAAGTSAAAAGGAVGTGGAVASVGALAGVGHVATLLAAAVVTAGGAVEIQHTLAGPTHHQRHHIAAAHHSKPHQAVAVAPDAATSSAPSVTPVVPSPPPATQAMASAVQQGKSAAATVLNPRKRAATAKAAVRNPAVADIPPSTIDSMTNGAGTPVTGTTVGVPPGDSTSTGTTSPTGVDGSTTDPTSSTGTSTGTPSTTAQTSTSTASGDVTSLGSSTGSSTPTTTSSGSTTTIAPATPSPVASFPSGGTSSGGLTHH
jgi:hypothetical protein